MPMATLEEVLQRLGQLPYGWHPPNGYPDVAGAWLSTNGLLTRWNSAMWLTHGAYSDPDWGYGMTTEIGRRVGTPTTVGALVDAVAEQVFGQVGPVGARGGGQVFQQQVDLGAAQLGGVFVQRLFAGERLWTRER